MGKRKVKNNGTLPVSNLPIQIQSDESNLSDFESSTQVSTNTFAPEEEGITIDQLIFETETAKSTDGRIKSLKHLIEYIKKVATCDELCNVSSNLMLTLEKLFRRDSNEAVFACKAAGLFAIIVGDETDYDVSKATTILTSYVRDKNCLFRAAAAQALAMLGHFTLNSYPHLEDATHILFESWSTFKTDSSFNVDFTAILNSWLLLVNDAKHTIQCHAFNAGVQKLTKYLESSNIETRISAGEALAFLYQLGCEDDEDFRFSNHHHLKHLFEEIVHESGKSHTKKDKRNQRYSFRQIMDIIFNGEYPTISVKYANRETLEISSCYERLIYNFLCIFLQGDVNRHIQKNPVVREAFSLPEKPIVDETLTKQEKRELRQQNYEYDKRRKIHRSKQRDKKAY